MHIAVQLCSTWSNSRRKISNLSRSWRSGKFMPLSLRPYSGNTFALSKVWFCTSTVNLRETDFASINSFLKKWIYANLILKPEELLLFRPVKSGGLGLVSIKQKSTAFLIRTFMEVAANPEYQTSQYLNSLYQFYILEEVFLVRLFLHITLLAFLTQSVRQKMKVMIL